MNRYEFADAIDEMLTMERRKARCLEMGERYKDIDPDRAEQYFQWADATSDEIGKRQNDLWVAAGRISRNETLTDIEYGRQG